MAGSRRGLKRTDERATLARITDEILGLDSRTGAALYEMGTRLARVRNEQLWRAGRYESFESYIERASTCRATPPTS
jgi:hypothetical protein